MAEKTGVSSNIEYNRMSIAMHRDTFAKRISHALLVLVSLTTFECVHAVDINVTTTADSGAGSLREAVTTAVAGDVIVFNIATPSPVITLASALPTLGVDVSFRNAQTDTVVIERNGTAGWEFTGGAINPTGLSFVNGGVPSIDADISAATATTLFGNGVLTGNLSTSGTLAPGTSAAAGSIGTFEVTGNLDASSATFNIDLASTGADLVQVGGVATLTNATLNPNFVDTNFAAGQSFTIVNAASITGAFANATSVFALSNQPFLQAIQDPALPANQFGLLIQDNGASFQSIVRGVNQTSAAIVLDELFALGTVTGVNDLRNGSTDTVNRAINQLSGSIYPSLIGAEINHIQANLASVRDRINLHGLCNQDIERVFWSRGYGINARTSRVRLQTEGYQQTIGGVELGGGLRSNSGWAGYLFGHMSDSQFYMRDTDHQSDVISYRMGGMVEFRNERFYAVAAGGGGTQEYSVQRNLDAFSGSTFAAADFDGNSSFGYAELGTYHRYNCCVWGPYAGIHTTRVELDPVTETGDADFALRSSGGDGESYRGFLGISFAQRAHTPAGLATTRLQAGWLHEFGDEFQTWDSLVASATINTLRDRGVPTGSNWGFFRAQVDMGTILGGQLTGSYLGQYNTRVAINTGMLGLQWTF